MTIGSIISGRGKVVSCAETTPVRDVVALLNEHRIGALLVIEGSEIRGIVSERDIVVCLHKRGAATLDASAADLMTRPVETITPATRVSTAMELMTERRFRHLPVVDSGRLVGIVSIGDLVKRRIEDAEREALLLKDYIATA